MQRNPPNISTAAARFRVVAPGFPVRSGSAYGCPGTSQRECPKVTPQVNLGCSYTGPPACLATNRPVRRNAMGACGVKLDAAPDTPRWGKVLICLPPVPVRIQRSSAAAATDTHPPLHRHTRQARPVHGGPGCPVVQACAAVRACRGSYPPATALGLAPGPAMSPGEVPRLPAQSRRTTGLATMAQAAEGGPPGPAGRNCAPADNGAAWGWRIAQQVARRISRSLIAGSNGRVSGRHPQLWKDPS